MKKKINIKSYILIVVSALIIIFTLYLNKRIYNASFEQYIYTLLKSSGTSSTSFIYGFIYVTLGVILLVPVLILPTIEFKKDIKIKNKRILPIKNIKRYSRILLVIAIVYLAYGVGLFGFIKNKLIETDLFKEYYVEAYKVEIKFPENKKNLIYIYLESMESTNFSIENGGIYKESIIPNLENIAKNNLNFSNTELLGGAQESYGTGWTVAAMIAQTAGIPLKMKLNDYEESSTQFNNIQTLGDILHNNGYNNYLLLGSNSVFGGRRAYFEKHNYIINDYQTAVETGKIEEDYFEWWGYEDSKLFEYAKEKLTEISKDEEPFNLTMLTADTHFTDGYIDKSCKVDVFEDKYANSFYCSDSMIKSFIDWIKEQDFYDNTVIILVGDHLTMQENFYDIDDYTRTIYNAFINVNVNDINNKKRIFTTMDMYPTTLGALGVQIEGNRLGLGTNLFSNKITIPEEIGLENFNEELKKNSNYYYDYIRG